MKADPSPVHVATPTPDDALRWVSEADVVAALSLPEAIDTLSAGLTANPEQLTAVAKTQAVWSGGASLHALGGIDLAAQIAGTKTWIHTPHGAAPVMVIWDLQSARVVAVVEAFALGQLRTAATTGVATRLLAEDATPTLAMIGTGKQALAQVAAVAAVRPLRLVKVFSPTPTKREAFAQTLRTTLRLDVEVCESAQDATTGAQIVTTATRATTPFLTADSVEADAHVNAIGAITPERAELSTDLVAACTAIVVDEPETARRLASELRHVSSMTTLSEALLDPPARVGRTLFKAMGSGVSDLILAAEVLRRRPDAGWTIPRSTRTPIRLGAAS